MLAYWRLSGMALLVLLAGCSYQGALDKLASRERQAEIIALAQYICTNPTKVTPKLHPEISSTLSSAASQLPGECPGAGKGVSWKLASYQWRTNSNGGVVERHEDAIVVATAPNKWTVFSLGFYQLNSGPQQIVKWNVRASDTKPSELQFIDDWEASAQTMKWVLPPFFVTGALLIFWLIRRRRARRAD